MYSEISFNFAILYFCVTWYNYFARDNLDFTKKEVYNMIKKVKDGRIPKEPYKVRDYYVNKHAIKRMNERKITKGELYYNLTRKPLTLSRIKYDDKGRPSYRKTTKNKITSAINPENKNVVSVNRLYTKEYKKIINQKRSKR